MRGREMSYSGNYNAVDRMLHRFAFFSPFVQKALSEVENDLFKRDISAIQSHNEVFITGLPRAGTTLMLELLFATGDFRTFTYREMPFILAPLLWNKLSRAFRKNVATQERAHGDGMEISVDSPEAFDEVIWLSYLGSKIVCDDRLSPVSAEDIDEEFIDAIRICVRKLLALPQEVPAAASLRYLSKNNANISRIEALRKVFPTSKVLIIFRHPLDHIGSLSRQHERFSIEHANDNFSRKYMEWIGHYEFGGNFKPIDFAGWLGQSGPPAHIDHAFWLKYWNAAYTHALEHNLDNVHFVDFDGLLRDGVDSLVRIAEVLGLTDTSALIKAGKILRAPTTQPVESDSCAQQDWERAQEIHSRLISLAV